MDDRYSTTRTRRRLLWVLFLSILALWIAALALAIDGGARW